MRVFVHPWNSISSNSLIIIITFVNFFIQIQHTILLFFNFIVKMDHAADAFRTDLMTITRFVLNEQSKHPESRGDFSILLSHIVLGCKFVCAAVNKVHQSLFNHYVIFLFSFYFTLFSLTIATYNNFFLIFTIQGFWTYNVLILIFFHNL